MINEDILAALNDILAVQPHYNEGVDLRRSGIRLQVEHPANPAHGDYSTNIAMQLAKVWRKPPLLIAQELRSQLLANPRITNWFCRVEIVPPGFINLYLDWEKWAAAPSVSTAAGTGNGQKAIIEHTSINPNKAAHVGHLRNSCIGDTLARMLKHSGYQVEVHNYIDDLGNQLADTLVGIHNSPNVQTYSRFGDFCWDVYAAVNRAYKAQPELQQKRTDVLHELEKGDTNTAWLGVVVAERIVREHLEEMAQFNIGYDLLVWESSIIREGFWNETFDLLQGTDIFRQETAGKLAGCWVLRQPAGDGEGGNSSAEAEGETGADDYQADKVLVRSNGILTYTAKDIAYHLWKFGILNRDFRYRPFAGGLWSTDRTGQSRAVGRGDLVVNVIDHRQEYPQAMVKQALAALGYQKQAEKLRHVSYGVVSLSAATARELGVDTSDGRSAYPMSGRQGIGVKAADILRQMELTVAGKHSEGASLTSLDVAAAAIRYYLLRFHLQTEVVFDLEQATEISGNTGVYLLYSCARAYSVLEKAGTGEALEPLASAALNELEPAEYGLLRQIAYWPETLHTAVQELAPHQLCNYLHELCTLFNHFYAACPIIKAEGSKRQLRIWLTFRFKETLQEGLTLLGLPAPRKM